MNLASPCVALCKLDEQDICIGCQRTIDEITHWQYYSESQKQAVFERLYKKSDTHSISINSIKL
ncbi:DUF1289 domain-containing protein [Alteromonas sp. KC3]|uniref:DUF1289 domain-containing protein n=1 Tax=unclassified Alteromonas TaxID=2614992 RepID=UPI0019220B7F|nr:MULTISPECIES: DUF1289 domain-containing protein [unclassified Alteromonas]BCO18496.1 DUF1289 domain-containing protein [Alteromonas sp. KC3]BCO22457.1 DUF1289 domain-containing protein [Alteromonas sp. KC14]